MSNHKSSKHKYQPHAALTLYHKKHQLADRGWLPLVGSLKLQVSFAKEPYKRDYSAKETYKLKDPTKRSHPIHSPPLSLKHTLKHLLTSALSHAHTPWSYLLSLPLSLKQTHKNDELWVTSSPLFLAAFFVLRSSNICLMDGFKESVCVYIFFFL